MGNNQSSALPGPEMACARSGPNPWPVSGPITDCPLAYFEQMMDHCYDFAEAEIKRDRPLVGIMCEYTPREIILAAGAWPVCLCGGSAKTIPAAEQHLPANLCPLIKSTFGYCVQQTNPFLKWASLVVAETTCDGKKKMFELMGQYKAIYVLELPQKPEDPDALVHWIAEVRKLKEYLEDRFQVQLTREKLQAAIQLMNHERALRRRLAQFMTADPPPLSGRQLLDFKSIISGIPEDLCQYEKAIAWLEHGARWHRPASITPAVKSPRVLLTGVPLAHGAERVLDLIENSGAVVVCMENCTGLKPILEDIAPEDGDPIAAIARKYFHLPCSVMTLNQRRLEVLRDLAAQYRVDCVIELVWHACLTYDVESFRVREFVERDLHLPYLKLNTDYSPSDSARLKLHIEALLETVRSRAGLRAGGIPA
jgi:benzoyl-CoA reductase/2-hydroxyglutaryl-CoA dehydratase subunit BcrC/BadD/HgdB